MEKGKTRGEKLPLKVQSLKVGRKGRVQKRGKIVQLIVLVGVKNCSQQVRPAFTGSRKLQSSLLGLICSSFVRQCSRAQKGF